MSLLHLPPPVPHTPQGLAGDSVGGLRKLSTSVDKEWNAGAVSVVSIPDTANAVKGVSFKTPKPWLSVMMGLSTSSDSENFDDIDFGLGFEGANGKVTIWESGQNRGTYGTYEMNSVGQVIVNNRGGVDYFVDGELRYRSFKDATFPLFADTSFLDNAAELTNIQWIGAAAIGAELQVGGSIHFTAFQGLTTDGEAGQLRKLATTGVAAWNAGAASIESIPNNAGVVKGVSVKVPQTSAGVVFGLCTMSHSASKSDLDFALYFELGPATTGGRALVYESGNLKATAGVYNSNSVGTVAINSQGGIDYSVDGEIRYTSRNPTINYPLYVDTSFYHNGGRLVDMKWVGVAASSAALQVGGNIHFTHFKGLAGDSDGGLRKLSTTVAGWNAGAVSVVSIPDAANNVKGVSFKSPQNDKGVMCGLSNLVMHPNSKYNPIDDIPGQGRSDAAIRDDCRDRCAAVAECAYWSRWSNGGCHLSSKNAVRVSSSGVDSGAKLPSSSSGIDIDFALYLHESGRMEVYEFGVFKGKHGTYHADSVGEVVINSQGGIDYKIDGETRYTSVHKGPVDAKHVFGTSDDPNGKQFTCDHCSECEILHTVSDLHTDTFDYTFTATHVTVHRTGSNDIGWGNEPGRLLSCRAAASVGADVVFTAAQGVSSGPGTLRKVSGGFNWNAGAVSNAFISDGWYQPEAVRSYSSVWVNDAIGTGHARSVLDSDQAWSAAYANKNQWMTIDIGSAVELTGVTTQGRHEAYQWVTSYKVATSADGITFADVESGRVFSGNVDRSTKKTNAFSAPIVGVRYVKIMPQTWDGHISMRADIIGRLPAGRAWVEIYEGGTLVGKKGTYGAGSVGRVSLNDAGNVEYLVDDEIRYTSLVAPTFPLFADTSFHTVGGRLTEVRWTTESVGTVIDEPVDEPVDEPDQSGATSGSTVPPLVSSVPPSASDVVAYEPSSNLHPAIVALFNTPAGVWFKETLGSIFVKAAHLSCTTAIGGKSVEGKHIPMGLSIGGEGGFLGLEGKILLEIMLPKVPNSLEDLGSFLMGKLGSIVVDLEINPIELTGLKLGGLRLTKSPCLTVEGAAGNSDCAAETEPLLATDFEVAGPIIFKVVLEPPFNVEFTIDGAMSIGTQLAGGFQGSFSFANGLDLAVALRLRLPDLNGNEVEVGKFVADFSSPGLFSMDHPVAVSAVVDSSIESYVKTMINGLWKKVTAGLLSAVEFLRQQYENLKAPAAWFTKECQRLYHVMDEEVKHFQRQHDACNGFWRDVCRGWWKGRQIAAEVVRELAYHAKQAAEATMNIIGKLWAPMESVISTVGDVVDILTTTPSLLSINTLAFSISNLFAAAAGLMGDNTGSTSSFLVKMTVWEFNINMDIRDIKFPPTIDEVWQAIVAKVTSLLEGNFDFNKIVADFKEALLSVFSVSFVEEMHTKIRAAKQTIAEGQKKADSTVKVDTARRSLLAADHKTRSGALEEDGNTAHEQDLANANKWTHDEASLLADEQRVASMDKIMEMAKAFHSHTGKLLKAATGASHKLDADSRHRKDPQMNWARDHVRQTVGDHAQNLKQQPPILDHGLLHHPTDANLPFHVRALERASASMSAAAAADGNTQAGGDDAVGTAARALHRLMISGASRGDADAAVSDLEKSVQNVIVDRHIGGGMSSSTAATTQFAHYLKGVKMSVEHLCGNTACAPHFKGSPTYHDIDDSCTPCDSPQAKQTLLCRDRNTHAVEPASRCVGLRRPHLVMAQKW